MKPEPKKKFPNKKILGSAKFEAKEQFTKSALENLKTEKERIVNSLKKSGEIDWFNIEIFKIFKKTTKQINFIYYKIIAILKMDKISLASAHLPQLIGLVLMSIGYTLGNKFYLPEVEKNK